MRRASPDRRLPPGRRPPSRNEDDQRWLDDGGPADERAYEARLRRGDDERRGGSGPTRVSAVRAGPYFGRCPKGWQRADARIYEDVCEVLAADEFVDPSNVEVEVTDGEVTLRGDIADRTQKRMAADLAESCCGVKVVHNYIHVVGSRPS